MTDETTTNETVTTTEATTPITAADVRGHDLFQKLTAEVKASKDALAELKQAQADEAQARKEAELEKSQNWDALKAEIAGKHEKELAARDAAILTERLTNKLVLANITNPILIDAGVRGYTPSDNQTLDEYVAAFVETDAVKALLAKAEDADPESTAIPAAPGGAAATRSTAISWAQAKADLQTNDKAKVDAAEAAVREFVTANGKMPPGF